MKTPNAELPQQQAEPVQEPVAKVTSSGSHAFPLLEWLSADHSFRCNIGDLLYTTPPQRPWVGLTVTTILNMMPSAIPAEYDGPLMEFARAVEAKLEKKNGY